ncbi:Organic cation transporter protein [Lamellibrachia satsuma]|nr:Organic cation transporter protein [Lamellibrachia satsuma]
MDPDEALLSLGNPWRNPWQMMVYNIVIGLLGIAVSMHVMAIVFVGGYPTHRCRIPVSVSVDKSAPYQDVEGNRRFDSCVVYENYSSATNRTIPCPLGWEFEHDSFTITEQWDLVCDKNVLTEMTQTVLVVGMLIGTMAMTPVADKFGRKLTFLVNACACSLVVFMTAMVNNYYLFTALRFLLGVFVEGTMISGFVLACEMFPAKYRTTAGVLAWIYWPVGMILLAGIAYVTRNWRYLLIVTSLPGLLALPLVWLIPESIPWLVAMGRVEEARQIIERLAKSSNIRLPMEYRLHSSETTELNKSQWTKSDSNKLQYTLVDIITSTKLRRYTFVLFYLWFAVTLVYSGLSLSSGTLAGNSYVNFSISGAVEIPAILITIPLYNRIGRRWPTCVLLLIAALCLLITLVVPQNTGADWSTVSVALNMISKFSITAAFGGIILCSMEVYPTTVRNIGFGIGIVGGKLGEMLAPYTSYFTRLAPWFLGVVFGSITVVGAFLMLLLPETLGRPLPQTIEEAECRVVASRQKIIIA